MKGIFYQAACFGCVIALAAAFAGALDRLNGARAAAEEVRADGGRLILKTNGMETVWYAENGMLSASGEDVAPADEFFASMDGSLLSVTIRKGGASRTLRVPKGTEAGA